MPRDRDEPAPGHDVLVTERIKEKKFPQSIASNETQSVLTQQENRTTSESTRRGGLLPRAMSILTLKRQANTPHLAKRTKKLDYSDVDLRFKCNMEIGSTLVKSTIETHRDDDIYSLAKRGSLVVGGAGAYHG